MEEVLPILHEIDLLQEEVCLLAAETFLGEHGGCCLFELIIGALNLFDVYLLLLYFDQD